MYALAHVALTRLALGSLALAMFALAKIALPHLTLAKLALEHLAFAHLAVAHVAFADLTLAHVAYCCFMPLVCLALISGIRHGFSNCLGKVVGLIWDSFPLVFYKFSIMFCQCPDSCLLVFCLSVHADKDRLDLCKTC